MDFSKVNEIMPVNMDGFQVVKGELFICAPTRSKPTLTVRPTNISFSKMSVRELNNCERVRIEINSTKKCVLIVPVTEKDKDGIRWTKNVKDPVPRTIECRGFTSQLYELWGWDERFNYRCVGKVVTAENKVMMLFDFNKPETWKIKEKNK